MVICVKKRQLHTAEQQFSPQNISWIEKKWPNDASVWNHSGALNYWENTEFKVRIMQLCIVKLWYHFGNMQLLVCRAALGDTCPHVDEYLDWQAKGWMETQGCD